MLPNAERSQGTGNVGPALSPLPGAGRARAPLFPSLVQPAGNPRYRTVRGGIRCPQTRRESQGSARPRVTAAGASLPALEPSPLSSPEEGVSTGCSAPGSFLNRGSRLPQDRVARMASLARVQRNPHLQNDCLRPGLPLPPAAPPSAAPSGTHLRTAHARAHAPAPSRAQSPCRHPKALCLGRRAGLTGETSEPSP